MANKKINELSVRTPSLSDLMLVGDPSTGYSYKATISSISSILVPNIALNDLTDVVITSVANGNLLAYNGTNWVNRTLGAYLGGTISQYVRGDGSLGDFSGGGGGGGASVSYYLNGSVNQGTFSGNTYYEMNKTPIVGAGTNFTINANGYIASFITDAGDPALLKIPGGNWNLEFYFSASSGGGTPSFYVELYKYDGTTFTLITSSSGTPEGITNGTSIDAYFTSLSVPETVLTLTDRLAIRVYVTHSGRTITMHTENNHLCQIITTFTTGLTALNNLTAQVQFFATGTSGTDFAISSTTATHTFNLPTASGSNRGALSSADWTTFNGKVGGSGTTNYVPKFTASGTIGDSQIFDNGTSVGVNTASPSASFKLDVNGSTRLNSISQVNFAPTNTSDNVFKITNTNTGSGTGYEPACLGLDNTGAANTIPCDIRLGSSNPAGIRIYASNAVLSASPTGAGLQFYTNASPLPGQVYFDSGAHNSASLVFRTAVTSGSITERMRVFADGNVGIGVAGTNAGFKLDVNGSLRATTGQFDNSAQVGKADNTSTYPTLGLRYASGSGADIQGYQGGSVSVKIRMQATNLYINTPGSMIFCNAVNETNESMRIVTTTKNVLIGTATDAGYKLEVSGTARVRESLFLLRSDAAATVEALKYTTNNTVDIGNTFRVIGTNAWNNTTSSTSYIQNGYSQKNFVITPTANGNYSGFDFSASSAFNPTIANPYNQKLINGAMTIQSTAANNFFGLDIRTTDNSSSIANNVYAIYGDATLGTNTSANRWAGYFVGRISNTLGATFATSSGNVLIGTTTSTGEKLQVNGSIYGTTLQTLSTDGAFTSSPWKLGEFVGNATTFDSSGWVGVEINGSYYRLALAQEQ